jgi:membrane-associated phospholipid phosphatase
MLFFDQIISLDKALFLYIQEHGGAAWVDGLMLLLRDARTWIPLYLFMGAWIFRKARPQAILFVVLTIATFAFCDFMSASVLKPMIARLRPCHDPDLAASMRGLLPCGGLFSFPSSHAANHFGLASFWFSAILRIKGKRWYWLWLWAAMIGFAQIYVGKHFPLDILGGALMGCFTGFSAAVFFKQWQSRSHKRSRHTTFVPYY